MLKGALVSIWELGMNLVLTLIYMLFSYSTQLNEQQFHIKRTWQVAAKIVGK